MDSTLWTSRPNHKTYLKALNCPFSYFKQPKNIDAYVSGHCKTWLEFQWAGLVLHECPGSECHANLMRRMHPKLHIGHFF